MPIQRLSVDDVSVLTNPGKRSEQLVWHRNAPDASVTITRVTMQPGAVSTRHLHARAEQIWIVERGNGTLLMAGEAQAPVQAGDIIRTPPGETHGIANTGSEPFTSAGTSTLVFFVTLDNELMKMPSGPA
jgi:mannose-6-phosphate isomerase-like protein (cupin superfamily)